MPDVFIAKGKTPARNTQLKEAKASQKPAVQPTSAASWLEPTRQRPMPFFTAFALHPKGVIFENQEADEFIILFLRRHLITAFRWVSICAITAGIPPLLSLLLTNFAITILQIPPAHLTIMLCFYYLLVLGYALTNSILWFYNVGIVTNLRVIDIDVISIGQKSVAATGLHDIVDVEYTQNGFLRSFFDYGDLTMQTEGLKENFEFLAIPKPAQVTDIMSDLIREHRE